MAGLAGRFAVVVGALMLAAGGALADPEAAADSDRASAATLRIRVTPPGSSVRVDGILIGTSLENVTLVAPPLSRGVHTLSVDHPGNSSWREHVPTEPGDTVEIDLQLGRDQPGTSKALALGFAVTGSAMTAGGFVVSLAARTDDTLSGKATPMIVGGLSGVLIAGLIHWLTRTTPARATLRRKPDSAIDH